LSASVSLLKRGEKLFYAIVLCNFNNLRLDRLSGSLCAFPGDEQWRIGDAARPALNLSGQRRRQHEL
jgi:hypothetical protein